MNYNCTLLEVFCVGYQPLLEWMHNDNYHRRVQILLVLVKEVEKSKNTQRVDVLNVLISPTNLLVGAFGSEGHGHGTSSLGQKRKLPRHKQKKKDAWIQAKQKLSQAEFQ
jgi:hypothetical protein